jgi:large subunit ribosomal protein L29
MKIAEINEKENDALTELLAERQKNLYRLRTQMVTEKLEDPSQLGKTKRDIARIKTVLRQRQIKQQQGGKK